jgi:hypothetical protein
MKLLRKYFAFIRIRYFANQETSIRNSRFPGITHNAALAKSANLNASGRHSAAQSNNTCLFFSLTHLQVVPSRPFR